MRIVAATEALRLAHGRIADARRIPRLSGEMLCAVAEDGQLVAGLLYERSQKLLIATQLLTNPTVPLLRRHHAAVQLAKVLQMVANGLGLSATVIVPWKVRSIWKVLRRAGYSPGQTPVMLWESSGGHLECGEPRTREAGPGGPVWPSMPKPAEVAPPVLNGSAEPAQASSMFSSPSVSSEASGVSALPSVTPVRSVLPPGIFIDRRPSVPTKPIAGKRRQGKVS